MDTLYQPIVKTRRGITMTGFKKDYEDAEGVLEFFKQHTKLEGDDVLQASIEEVDIEDAVRVMYPEAAESANQVHLPEAIENYKNYPSNETGYFLILAIFAYREKYKSCQHDYVVQTEGRQDLDGDNFHDFMVCRKCGMVDWYAEYPELFDGDTRFANAS